MIYKDLKWLDMRMYTIVEIARMIDIRYHQCVSMVVDLI